jgi:two-component system chemotaxis response regulator CheB
MIVDDSMVARAVLSRMIESDGDFEIAPSPDRRGRDRSARPGPRRHRPARPRNARRGRAQVDPRILEARAARKVLIVSSLAEEGAEETVAALALGAADTLPKPGTGRFNGRFSEILLSKLRALGYADRASRATRPRAARPPVMPLRAMPSDPIGCSRSAPRPAASTRSAPCSRRLPAAIGVPILVTQHLPAPFMPCSRASSAPPPGARRWSPRTACGCSRPDRHRAGRRPSDLDRAGATVRVRLTSNRRRQRLPAVGRPDAGLGRRVLRRARSASC